MTDVWNLDQDDCDWGDGQVVFFHHDDVSWKVEELGV